MITFIISLIALVAGYFIYGRVVERIFAPYIRAQLGAEEEGENSDR